MECADRRFTALYRPIGGKKYLPSCAVRGGGGGAVGRSVVERLRSGGLELDDLAGV